MDKRAFPITVGLIRRFHKLTNDRERQSAIVFHILIHFFGREWFNRTIMPLRTRQDFFRVPPDAKDPDAPVSNENDLAGARLSQLATHLLNLWLCNVPGFDDFLREFRDDPSEGRFAEICLAAHMCERGVRFAFQKKTATKGYDFLVATNVGFDIAVETKCRTYGTRFNATKIWKTMRDAIKEQLPSDMPCALFVHMQPELMTPERPVDDLMVKLFGRYDHVVTVVLYSVRLVPDGNSMHYYVRHREIPNPQHKYRGVNRIFRRALPVRNWVRISDMQKQILEASLSIG